MKNWILKLGPNKPFLPELFLLAILQQQWEMKLVHSPKGFFDVLSKKTKQTNKKKTSKWKYAEIQPSREEEKIKRCKMEHYFIQRLKYE